MIAFAVASTALLRGFVSTMWCGPRKYLCKKVKPGPVNATWLVMTGISCFISFAPNLTYDDEIVNLSDGVCVLSFAFSELKIHLVVLYRQIFYFVHRSLHHWTPPLET